MVVAYIQLDLQFGKSDDRDREQQGDNWASLSSTSLALVAARVRSGLGAGGMFSLSGM